MRERSFMFSDGVPSGRCVVGPSEARTHNGTSHQCRAVWSSIASSPPWTVAGAKRWAGTTFWPAAVPNQNRPYPSWLTAPIRDQHESGVGPLSTWA